MEMSGRAFTLIDVKSFDEEQRVIEGIASTPKVDRVGDVIEPLGAVFKMPMPLLLDHDTRAQVGHVEFAKPTKDGIPFRARIVKVSEPGEVKDLVDKAWQLVKYKLRSAVSIGFRALEDGYEIMRSGGIRFTAWEWVELSLISVPAQDEAVILSAKGIDDMCLGIIRKSIDTTLRAASGREQRGVVRLNPPGVTGKTQPIKTPMEGKTMKVSEKIAAFEAKRAANAERVKVIHESTDESLNEEQRQEVDGLEAEIATIDKELPSLKRIEADLAKTAKPIVQTRVEGAPDLTPTPNVSVKAPEKLEPGIQFTRLVKVKMAARLTAESPLVMAQRMYGADSDTVGIIRKANEVVAGTTLSGNWAADLVSAEGAALAAFLEYLRPATILGKFGTGGIPSLTRIDFYSPYVTQTGGGAAYWVGEGKPKPLTAFDYDRSTLTPLKIANICVLTEENIRYSTPNSDMLVRNALVEAIVAGIDVAFVDPANAGTANVKPASVTNGADTYASTATTDADAIRTEIRAVFQTFIDANNPPMQGVWIMSATNALALGMLVNTLGQPEFPGIGMMGGTLQGLPVIVSQHIGDVVALVNARDIFLGDEGGVNVDMSREASIEMRSAGLGMDATAGTATAASVSMFQTNSVALRAERTINWKLARASAVAYLSSVVWGGAVPALS
jgi:hypothetical protein